jgi:DNA-binding IclR family transcriptional regulator
VPRVKAKPTRRGTGASALDDVYARVLAAVGKSPRGLALGEIAGVVGINRNSLKVHLVSLVKQRRLVQKGVRAGTRYWPADRTAKEAL